MSTYQVLFHGSGFDVSLDGASGSIVGFYTARRVQADGPDEAYLTALDLLKSEEKTKFLIGESVSNGANPRFGAEEIFEVSFLNRIFGRYPKGFVFYEDTEESDNEPAENRSEHAGDGKPDPASS